MKPLPPTDPDLEKPDTRPYFLWWTDASVAQLREHLASRDEDERAYWMGALLREANSRDVWLFVAPGSIRALWPKLLRHLGRTRERWAWLLRQLPVRPLPALLEPLTEAELVEFRDALRERMRPRAVPAGPG